MKIKYIVSVILNTYLILTFNCCMLGLSIEELRDLARGKSSENGVEKDEFPVIKIYTHPESRNVILGSKIVDINLFISAGVTMDAELSYQWFSNNNASSSGGTAINGATSTNITIPYQTITGNNYYFCEVRASGGAKSVRSNVAVVAFMNPNALITVEPDTQYQYVRGFGGTASVWENFPEISIDEYEKMFDPDTGLGLNILRIMIAPEEDIENTDPEKIINYYVTGIKPNYVEGVKIVNKHGGYVLATSWSPPPEWKTNDSINGKNADEIAGSLKPEYYGEYAEYLNKFAQIMIHRDAPIYAISIQHEPNYVANSYAGCLWTPEELRDFHKQVGLFTSVVSGYGNNRKTDRVLIMSGEDSDNPASSNDVAMNDPESRQYIDLIGRQQYQIRQGRYANALDLPDPKEVWMTDQSINSDGVTPQDDAFQRDTTWNYVWKYLNSIDLTIRLNDESAFLCWAIKRFYNVIGDGRYGTTDGEILPRGYAMSHYAKYAKETRRIELNASGTTGSGAALSLANFNNYTFNQDSTAARATAFMSEDGNSISMVLFTPTTTSGSGGVNMGVIRIELPFSARTAAAIRSTSSVKAIDEDVLLSEDGYSAFVTLPAGEILSVRFNKIDVIK